jgi:hypothetical protein
MTTRYFICIRAAVGHGIARHERDRVFRRRAFSTWRNFLATHIRQRLVFRTLPLHRRALVLGVILSALIAPPMLGVGEPMEAGLLELATTLAAVALSPVVAPTDEERPRAPAAAQLEEVVHPSRKDENWTAPSRSGNSTHRTGCPSVAGASRVQAATWALTRFIRRSGLHERAEPRDFSAPSAALGHDPIAVRMIARVRVLLSGSLERTAYRTTVTMPGTWSPGYR